MTASSFGPRSLKDEARYITADSVQMGDFEQRQFKTANTVVTTRPLAVRQTVLGKREAVTKPAVIRAEDDEGSDRLSSPAARHFFVAVLHAPHTVQGRGKAESSEALSACSIIGIQPEVRLFCPFQNGNITKAGMFDTKNELVRKILSVSESFDVKCTCCRVQIPVGVQTDVKAE